MDYTNDTNFPLIGIDTSTIRDYKITIDSSNLPDHTIVYEPPYYDFNYSIPYFWESNREKELRKQYDNLINYLKYKGIKINDNGFKEFKEFIESQELAEKLSETQDIK